MDVHVASRRYVFDPERPYPHYSWRLGESVEQLIEETLEMDDALEHARLEPIRHPDAGKSWTGLDYRTAYGLLLRLRDEGFHVPDSALESLHEDMLGD